MKKIAQVLADAFGLVCLIGIGYCVLALLHMLIVEGPL